MLQPDTYVQCKGDDGKRTGETGVTRPGVYEDVDGMITDVPGVVLATFYADCVPLYFVDPVHRAVGLSHSGWRGTAAGIGRVTVRKNAGNIWYKTGGYTKRDRPVHLPGMLRGERGRDP